PSNTGGPVMTEENREPSGALRLALRVDAFTSSTWGIITLTMVLGTLLLTGTTAGIVAAVLVFAAVVALGVLGRRHERLSGPSRTAGDR
ncbi:hypothetical protein ACFU2K_31845, partial [Streptomyces sp. NPDC057409]